MLTQLTHRMILAATVGVAAFNAPNQLATELGLVAMVVVLSDLGYGLYGYKKKKKEDATEGR
jgi:hypothetical protein